jgi:hypothetical protein
MTDTARDDAPARVGLCATCAHVQIVTSSKRTTFYLCKRSDTDPRFRRYPALPVVVCAGYEAKPRPER